MAKKDKKSGRKGEFVPPDMSGKPFEDGRANDPMMCICVRDVDNVMHEFKFTPEEALQLRKELDQFIGFVREHGYMIVE